MDIEIMYKLRDMPAESIKALFLAAVENEYYELCALLKKLKLV
jgi:hypothetical protein